MRKVIFWATFVVLALPLVLLGVVGTDEGYAKWLKEWALKQVAKMERV